jgi:hypothetical protein
MAESIKANISNVDAAIATHDHQNPYQLTTRILMVNFRDRIKRLIQVINFDRFEGPSQNTVTRLGRSCCNAKGSSILLLGGIHVDIYTT